MTSHDELRDTLKTGDLVLFSGKSAFSATIRLVTGSRWSHVGMVMRLEEFEDAMLLLESSLLVDPRVLDIQSDEAVQGVQLVPLYDRLSTYSGGSALRRLEPALSDSMRASLDELREELARRPFEQSRVELLRAVYDGPLGQSPGADLSSLFCSELVAEAYQVMGLLPSPPAGLPSNEFTPADFSERRGMQLELGYRLGPELELD